MGSEHSEDSKSLPRRMRLGERTSLHLVPVGEGHRPGDVGGGEDVADRVDGDGRFVGFGRGEGGGGDFGVGAADVLGDEAQVVGGPV